MLPHWDALRLFLPLLQSDLAELLVLHVELMAPQKGSPFLVRSTVQKMRTVSCPLLDSYRNQKLHTTVPDRLAEVAERCQAGLKVWRRRRT